MDSRRKTLKTVGIITLVIIAIPFYLINYWKALPSPGSGRAVIVEGSNSTGEINVGAAYIYFETRITLVRIFSPKRIELNYQLKKPDGEIVQLWSYGLTRGLEFADIFYIVPQNATSIFAKDINLPGTYELSASAEGYKIKPITFTVKDSPDRQAVDDLFISNLANYKLVKANLIDSMPAGYRLGISSQAMVLQYDAVYREATAISNDSLTMYVTDSATAKEYLNNEIKLTPPDGQLFKLDRSMLVRARSYSNYTQESTEPTYIWTSNGKIIKLIFTTYSSDMRVKQLVDAYRQKFPPDSVE